MRQRWHDLLFVHFTAAPEAIAALLPTPLEIETFPDASGEPKAWIGLVPFGMRDIAVSPLPSVPGTSAFLEANVRTYVRQPNGETGVWFISLDAANALACGVARATFGLPYFPAKMSMRRDADVIEYQSLRQRGFPLSLKARYRVLDPLPKPEPGSLDHWLVERYRLYALRRGALLDGMVYHDPYELHGVEIQELEHNVAEQLGCELSEPVHCVYSPGVSVSIGATRKILQLPRGKIT